MLLTNNHLGCLSSVAHYGCSCSGRGRGRALARVAETAEVLLETLSCNTRLHDPVLHSAAVIAPLQCLLTGTHVELIAK